MWGPVFRLWLFSGATCVPAPRTYVCWYSPEPSKSSLPKINSGWVQLLPSTAACREWLWNLKGQNLSQRRYRLKQLQIFFIARFRLRVWEDSSNYFQEISWFSRLCASSRSWYVSIFHLFECWTLSLMSCYQWQNDQSPHVTRDPAKSTHRDFLRSSIRLVTVPYMRCRCCRTSCIEVLQYRHLMWRPVTGLIETLNAGP